VTELRVFVGLGSNLGDRLTTLRKAIEALAALPGVELRRCSSAWETHPMGPGSGPFLNAAVELACTLSVEDLLTRTLTIEAQAGRVRRQRWGDRTLDLDLLCAFDPEGNELHRDDGDRLILPHPGHRARDFVLQPLLELDPNLEIDGRSCAALLEALPAGERTIMRCLDDPLGLR